MIADLLGFIRDNAGRPIGVPDVFERTNLSRRTLERQFSEVVGHTIHDEIISCRLERAKRLLFKTESIIERVAVAAGFSHKNTMILAFRRVEGCSPWEYRRQSRGEH